MSICFHKWIFRFSNSVVLYTSGRSPFNNAHVRAILYVISGISSSRFLSVVMLMRLAGFCNVFHRACSKSSHVVGVTVLRLHRRSTFFRRYEATTMMRLCLSYSSTFLKRTSQPWRKSCSSWMDVPLYTEGARTCFELRYSSVDTVRLWLSWKNVFSSVATLDEYDLPSFYHFRSTAFKLLSCGLVVDLLAFLLFRRRGRRIFGVLSIGKCSLFMVIETSWVSLKFPEIIEDQSLYIDEIRIEM